MISIIEESQKWKETLLTFDHYDFYHTYDYHMISKKVDEKPILVHFMGQNFSVAIPFLLRPIANSPFFDLTSVYGYAGPIFFKL